jgi:hypothetical protein
MTSHVMTRADRMCLHTAARDPHTEFRGIFGTETIESLLLDSNAELASTAAISSAATPSDGRDAVRPGDACPSDTRLGYEPAHFTGHECHACRAGGSCDDKPPLKAGV